MREYNYLQEGEDNHFNQIHTHTDKSDNGEGKISRSGEENLSNVIRKESNNGDNGDEYGEA